MHTYIMCAIECYVGKVYEIRCYASARSIEYRYMYMLRKLGYKRYQCISRGGTRFIKAIDSWQQMHAI
jgi:hypothetical protein